MYMCHANLYIFQTLDEGGSTADSKSAAGHEGRGRDEPGLWSLRLQPWTRVWSLSEVSWKVENISGIKLLDLDHP